MICESDYILKAASFYSHKTIYEHCRFNTTQNLKHPFKIQP